ncbi:MAG TPA: glycosyltransferase [Stenomitos sp.]
MNIIAMPAFENRDKNPYNWLLYTSMKDLGVKVDEFSSLSLLRNRYAIWHLHWPDGPLNYRNPLKAFLKIQALLLQIDWARSQGVKIVWTVHNLANHEKRYPKLEAWFWRAFTQRLDGYISLSQMGIQSAQERFPQLSHLPGFVIPHSHYRGEYPDYVSPQEARASLGIPPEAKMLLFFGRIRPYKNVPALIRAFREFPQQDVILYIAGRPEPATLEQELQKEAASDSRIKMHLEFIPDDKAQLYFRAADLVILPYREILNSGSALLALSFDCPVLVPLRGALSELQNQVGEQWIKTYEGEITSAQIEAALKWVLNTPRPKQPPLETLDWQELAGRTIDAYKAIAAHR